MAGDWIKMRIDLQSHPKVVRILSATASDKFRAIGGLHAVWSVFDTHSEDGVLHGYTPETMDHIIGWPGFSNALIAINWLVWDGQETLSMPEFTEHNGKSGKRRAEDQKRKKNGRQSVRNSSAEEPDKKWTREEKRREELTPKSKAEPASQGSRLQIEILPQDWRAFCQQERSDLDPERTFAKFCDYWKAKPGKQGTKLDWLATWRNWVREERKINGSSSGKFNVHAYTRNELAKALAAEALGAGPAQEIQPALPGEVCEFIPRSGNGQ